MKHTSKSLREVLAKPRRKAKKIVRPSAMEELSAAWKMDTSIDDPQAPYFLRIVDLAWHHSTDLYIAEKATERLTGRHFKKLNSDKVIDEFNMESLVQIVATHIAAYRQGTISHGRREVVQHWNHNKVGKPSESGKLRQNLDVYLDTVCRMSARVNQSQPFKDFPKKGASPYRLIYDGKLDHEGICEFVMDSLSRPERLEILKLKPEEEILCRVLLSDSAKALRDDVGNTFPDVTAHLKQVLVDLDQDGKPGPKMSALQVANYWAALKFGGGKVSKAVEIDRQRLGLWYGRTDEGRRLREAHTKRVARAKRLLAATEYAV